MELERRLRLFIVARMVVSFLFLASTLWLSYQQPASLETVFQYGIVKLMVTAFLFSVVSLFALSFQHLRLFLTYLQTIWDLLFVTVLLLFTDGILSPYSFLYLLSIMNAGVLLGRRQALYTASLCTILYGAIVDFQYFGLLSSIGLNQADAVQVGASRIFYTIFLNLMGFVLTAVITGYLAERVQSSEAALQEKIVDYTELEHLNSSIVANIETGLLTITPDGVIKVFNPYAELLCGMTQEDVYNNAISTIFPELSMLQRPFDTPVSGEFSHISPDGLTKILAYNVAPFHDAAGKHIGSIVSIKDLTAMKRMENALKQADRLAALGELSARMAHEIRNPLAAMRGSVQLLAEHAALAENDQRLLAIVIREADRLNHLIGEFLAYARPVSPQQESIELFRLVEELRMLLSADEHFQSIQVINEVPAHMTIRADANQMKQVFINLLKNAADAMSGSGTVSIAAQFLLNGSDGFRKAPIVYITVHDSGPGIDNETALHLFEPFWSTKKDGTGLGLAITYRIIDSHGGTITADTAPEGGGRISILLPV